MMENDKKSLVQMIWIESLPITAPSNYSIITCNLDSMLLLSSADFFKINFFKKFFEERYHW